MAIRGKDYSGSRFNHLTMLRYERPGGQGVGSYWLTLCDCGTTKVVLLKNATSGRVKTCGNCSYHTTLLSAGRDGRSAVGTGVQRLFQRSLRNAATRGIAWQLTLVQFRDIITGRCQLCNQPPMTRMKKSRLVYSDVGRVDETGPYTPGNSYTSCRTCQSMRGHRTLQEYLDHVSRVVDWIRAANTNPSDPARE